MKDMSLNEKHAIDTVTNSATSGNLFSGKKIRYFPDDQIRFKGKMAPTEVTKEEEMDNNKNKFECTKWAVVTTIFEPPSEAVRRFLYRKDWCVVVVGDKEKPGKVIR